MRTGSQDVAVSFAFAYIDCMSKTIAVRVDPELQRAIEERARASGQTVSEVVRETLRDALAERPLSERIGHLRGALDVRVGRDDWRRALRERNWRR
jgi:Arc/MetJ-type ribon-helix-helix transcriptional regulator